MSVAQLITSIALLAATVVLAVYTANLWLEARAARLPRVVGNLYLLPPSFGELRVVNAGQGAAFDVEVEFGAVGDERRHWSTAVLLPGEGWNFKLHSSGEYESLNQWSGKYQQFTVSARYADIRGKVTDSTDTLELEQMWRQVAGSHQLAPYRGPLAPILDEVEKLTKAMQSLADRVARQ